MGCNLETHRNHCKFKASVIPPLCYDIQTLLHLLNQQLPRIVAQTQSHVEYHKDENTLRIYAHSIEQLRQCKQELNTLLYFTQHAPAHGKNHQERRNITSPPPSPLPLHSNHHSQHQVQFNNQQQHRPLYRLSTPDNTAGTNRNCNCKTEKKWKGTKRESYLSMVLCNEPRMIFHDITQSNRCRLFHPHNHLKQMVYQIAGIQNDHFQMLRYRNIGEMFGLYSSRSSPSFSVTFQYGVAYFRQADSSLAEFEDCLSGATLFDVVTRFIETQGLSIVPSSKDSYFMISVDTSGTEYYLHLYPNSRSKLECKKVMKAKTEANFDIYLVDSKYALDLRFSCFRELQVIPSANDITSKLQTFLKAVKYTKKGGIVAEDTRYVGVLEVEKVEAWQWSLNDYLNLKCECFSSSGYLKIWMEVDRGLTLTHPQFLKTIELAQSFCGMF